MEKRCVHISACTVTANSQTNPAKQLLGCLRPLSETVFAIPSFEPPCCRRTGGTSERSCSCRSMSARVCDSCLWNDLIVGQVQVPKTSLLSSKLDIICTQLSQPANAIFTNEKTELAINNPKSKQSTNQPTDLLTYQPTNQTSNRSTKLTNLPTNHPTN